MKAARKRRKICRRARTEQRARCLPTPERMRLAGADFERGDSGHITMRDSPLERAFARKVVTPEQYAAGQKYRLHWYQAGLCGALESVDLNRVVLRNYAGMTRTESQAFHSQRFREAAHALGNVESRVLELVVCRDVALDRVGYALGWNNRHQAYAAAVERMKNGLDALCNLWGMGAAGADQRSVSKQKQNQATTMRTNSDNRHWNNGRGNISP